MFICLRPPPLLGFWLGWSSNSVGSESGKIRSVKLLQNMVSNRTQQPHPLPITHCLYFDMGKGGGRWTKEKVKGAKAHKAGSKYQHDWLYLQYINYNKHMPQSLFTGQFFKWRYFDILFWCLLDNYSMPTSNELWMLEKMKQWHERQKDNYEECFPSKGTVSSLINLKTIVLLHNVTI